MIHTVKGFNIVNEAEVDVFLEFSCFFYDPRGILLKAGKQSLMLRIKERSRLRDQYA